MSPQEPGAEFEALRDEIRHGRAELGETVEALAAKADVRANAERVARKAADRAAGVGRAVIRRRATWMVAALGALLAVAATTLVRRRR